MTLQLPRQATSFVEAMIMLDNELDALHRASLSATYETPSGIVKLKTHSEISHDLARRDAIARAISRLYGYYVSEVQILAASYERIDGARLRDESAERVRQYRERHA